MRGDAQEGSSRFRREQATRIAETAVRNHDELVKAAQRDPLTDTPNRTLMLEALPRLGLERIAPPDGAFYIYADISRFTDDSLGFCLKLLEETGVAAAPGVDFDPIRGARTLRFSYARATADIGVT